MASIDRVDHLSLSVTDLARSTEWYRKVFGLTLVAEVRGSSFHRTRLQSDSGMTLALTAHQGSAGESFDERRPGMDHVAFRVAGGSDLGAIQAALEELGATHSGIQQLSGGVSKLTLRDPDNIQLEVLQAP